MLMAILWKGEGMAKTGAKEAVRPVSARRVAMDSAGPEEEIMNEKRSPRSVQEAATDAPGPTSPETQTTPDLVETAVAPAAIERALAVYQQLHPRDQSVIVQARKILTQHIYGMVDQGERDEQRLTVGGLAHLKAIERDHDIKSARGAETSPV
jgi:hypothetical protein